MKLDYQELKPIFEECAKALEIYYWPKNSLDYPSALREARNFLIGGSYRTLIKQYQFKNYTKEIKPFAYRYVKELREYININNLDTGLPKCTVQEKVESYFGEFLRLINVRLSDYYLDRISERREY